MNIKKIFLVLIISLIISSFIPVLNNEICAYASSGSCSTFSSQQNIHIVNRAEQKVWKYRTVDGKVQKRLWSKTYDKWLTDWKWA